MKAIQAHEPGDVSKLSVADLFISDPKAQEVQVPGDAESPGQCDFYKDASGKDWI